MPSLVRGWITATLCITAYQTLISEGYRTQPAPYTANWRTDRLVVQCNFVHVLHRFRDKATYVPQECCASYRHVRVSHGKNDECFTPCLYLTPCLNFETLFSSDKTRMYAGADGCK